MKQAQEAMEFMMAYGWAILSVVVVIGALAYFGVFDVSNFLPERCTLSSLAACTDYQVGSNGIAIALQNTAGRIINISSITFTSAALPGTCTVTTSGVLIRPGETATFIATGVNCQSSATGKATYDFIVSHTIPKTSLVHEVSGQLFAGKVPLPVT
jgi:hypothetical protein